MSGPKDYTVGFGVGLLEMMAARAAAERAARQAAARRVSAGHAAAVRADLGREAATGASVAAAEQSARAADAQASLEANRERAAAARQQAERTATPPPAVAPPPVAAVARAAAVPDPAVAQAAERTAELAGWREVLATDPAVADFAAADAAAWASRAAAATGPGVDALLAEAQAIHDRAGTLKGQFDTRNELLAAVIASFHEIGFHVDEPFFEQPGNPAGAVVLKASCGSDTVESKLDLSDHIKTVWGGTESDHCKDSFFEFVGKMKNRGLDVTPDRADLQDRPTLLQKSANELPQAGRAGG